MNAQKPVQRLKWMLTRTEKTYLTWRSRWGNRWRAGSILQWEMCNEYDEFGKSPSNLCTGALKQVLREAVWICKEDVVCKPVTHILTMSQQDAKSIIPETKTSQVTVEEHANMCLTQTNIHTHAYQSLAGPRTTFLVWNPVLKRNLAASCILIIAISSASGKRWSWPKRQKNSNTDG